ncbi:MAG: hypothetical protein K0S65_4041 [Labilithrix sp.]|nr:hypothetical protein [Labilithrix sp.]
MFRRSLVLFAALSFASVPFFAGCAADASDEEVAPVDEATDDVVSVSKLLGQYIEGQGRYASLSLSQVTENGRRTNRYEGKQIVQCTRAPCPTVAVHGKWFASKTSLTLYPEGQPRESYKAALDGTKLTLTNAQGVHIAELTKAVPAPNGVGAALQKHGVPNMRVEIDAAEIAKQASAPGVTVSFDAAIDQALELFLTDQGALRGTTDEFADDLQEECGANTDLVLCLANAPRTYIRLQKLEDETAPGGESANEAWVFVFFVEDFTDHGYFAVIDKKGQGAHVYAFN